MINYSIKKAILLTVFLSVGLCMYGQTSAAPSAAQQPKDESAIYLDQTGGAGNAGSAAQSAPSSVWILVRIVLALAVVGAGIYGVVYLLKKTSHMDGSSDKFIKSVASLPLAQNRSVQIVTAGTQAFLIGITEKNISLISEITDKELIDAMNLEAGKKTPVPGGNFAALLASFMPPRARKDNESAQPESAVATAEFLKRQRERISGGFSGETTDERSSK